MDTRDLPFSTHLRTFHQRLASVAWEDAVPSCVFVRDSDGLPDQAPFDIDVMVENSDLGSFRSVFELEARDAGLVCVLRVVPQGLHILLLDFVVDPAARTWAYYEIATEKRLTKSFVLSSRLIAIERSGGLPVPDLRWRFLIHFAQALRKGDLRRHEGILRRALENDPCSADLCISTLGLRLAAVRSALNDHGELRRLAHEIGIEIKKPKLAGDLAWRTKIRLWAIRHLYFLPASQICLFTIHGPDGVGKTTAIRLVRDMFRGYPIGMDSAHHVTSWKHGGTAGVAKVAAAADVSLLHKLLRVIYRAAPQFLCDVWVTSSGYHKYSRNVNAEVYRSYLARHILLLDRYIYDVSVKERVRHTCSRIGHAAAQLHCFIMRRPALAIVLQDDPSAILRRKQELSAAQIQDYQMLMRRMLNRFRVPFTVIEIGGRSPESVAREVAAVIVRHIAADLHVLLRYQIQDTSRVSHPAVLPGDVTVQTSS